MKKLIYFLNLLLPLSGFAQSHTIDWHKISGGGTSTNARFAVSGTIGQPEASGALTGGRYAVAGGFWSIYAVQTANAPVLRLQPQFAFSGYVTNTFPGPHYGEISTVTNLVAMKLSWPSPAAAVTVQQSSDLIHWSDYSGPVQDNGTTQSISVTPTSGSLFFRLWR